MSLMKIGGVSCTILLLVTFAQSLLAASIASGAPAKTALLDARHDLRGSQQLIPWKAKQQWLRNKHRNRMHMLYREPAKGSSEEEPIKDCVACVGTQVQYGKYTTEDGDTTDNSFFLFKDPKKGAGKKGLPTIIQFHGGGFFMGAPWKKENAEIRDYLRKGFAVVSVGYRLVSQKYFYDSDDGKKQVEELIHIAEDGLLELDEDGKTMDDYKVRVGKQEFMTKFLFDAAAMIETLCEKSDSLGLDPHNIVFVGESSGGAGIQYLTWIYHKLNKGLYTPRGMILTNAQLDYPVDNMLSHTWDIFAETLGSQVKLSDVVSKEACPIVVGNHMCDSEFGKATDYNLCNEAWNKESLDKFCGDNLASATLGEVAKSQKFPGGGDDGQKSDAKVGENQASADKKKDASEDDKNDATDDKKEALLQTKKHKEEPAEEAKEDKEDTAEDDKTGDKDDVESGKNKSTKKKHSVAHNNLGILWYTSENMQQHLPAQPFYIYIANSRNGTSHTDIAHHSIYALNFAKYAEMDKSGGLEYTVYYTDFARMSKADKGMQRVQVSRRVEEMDDNLTYPIGAIPPASLKYAAGANSPIPAALSPLPAPAPAPGADNGFITEVYNYLSTHDWRESIRGNDVESVSLDERVLYACLAAGMGPFHGVVKAEENTTTKEPATLKGAAIGRSLVSFSLSLILPVVAFMY